MASEASPSKPAGVYSDYDYRKLSGEDVSKSADQLIEDCRKVYDGVGSVKPDDVTFANILKPLLDVDRDSYTRGVALQLAGMVALDKEVRDASCEAEKKMDEFSVEMAMRKDIFDNMVAFSKTGEAGGLDPEHKRYLDRLLIEGKRNGLDLPEDKRKEITEIKKKISELGVNFNKNLNEDTSHLWFKREELEGVPEDLLDSLEKNDEGQLKVTMKYPHFFPVSRKCKNPETRKIVEKTFNSRCMEENVKIIEEILELRQKEAEILGYPNHAAYVQEMRMAKNPETVSRFLKELEGKLQPLWSEERKVMLKLKEDECKELGLNFNGKLDYWDMRYYQTMVEQKNYAVDQQQLKEYFPMEVVTAGLLDIYQKILGLKYTKLENMQVWDKDVTVYEVKDVETEDILGYFYLDLYPRDGKYGHACMVQLQQGCLDGEGKRDKSVVAMICNFSKSTAERPSLLDHKEVETYFHEFGHVMHGICSKANTSKFFGTHVERDFVEAPSQMLENWVWKEESLKLMSKHYKDGSELPKDMLDKLIASKKANAGVFNLRQILLATFDQRLHQGQKVNTADLMAQLSNEILGLDVIPGTNFAAHFGHLVGYDAQYYGYMWSEVYSEDMFETRFGKEGVLNPATGKDYRNLILAPGGSKDGMDLLRSFLGREPTQEAFLRSKGLSTS